MRRRTVLLVTLLVVGCSVAQESPQEAEILEQTKASMDFWVGEWDVYTMDGKLAGTNRIEKVMSGAAIIEHWENSAGIEGKSWFYWMADKQRWKQVWVTPDGSYKEKVAEAVEGGLLFTGTGYSPDGRSWPDRTRLTVYGEDEVRQEIETSKDGGQTWTKEWDSVYRRKSYPSTSMPRSTPSSTMFSTTFHKAGQPRLMILLRS